MKFTPVDVKPGTDNGCPCFDCDCDWRQLTYADGFVQRSGICPHQYDIIVCAKAGTVPPECPKKDEGGRVVDEVYRFKEETYVKNEDWEEYVRQFQQRRQQIVNSSTKRVAKETVGSEGAFS